MSERTSDYIRGLCPSCRTEQKLYIHHSVAAQKYWLACPFCEWTQNEYHPDADAAVQAYDDIPLASVPPAIDYLKLARQSASDNYYEDASAYAAIAQAEAMQRIAECLETMLDSIAESNAADSLERTARIWGS